MCIFRLAGLHLGEHGVNPIELLENGPPAGVGVAAVIVSCDALENTRRCIETLQAKEDPRHPQTIVVVDNGSCDGSAEWLQNKDGVHLIRNEINHGAPRARNQAIRWLMEQGERPEWFLFLDNDVFVTESWAHRALYHGEVDPSVGSVALCASRASKKQVVPYDGPDDQASLDAFAHRHASDTGRRGVDATLFTSSRSWSGRRSSIRSVASTRPSRPGASRTTTSACAFASPAGGIASRWTPTCTTRTTAPGRSPSGTIAGWPPTGTHSSTMVPERLRCGALRLRVDPRAPAR